MSKRRRPCAVGALLLAALVFSAPRSARAQPHDYGTPAAKKKAQTLLDLCNGRNRAQDCSAALQPCTDAYAIYPDPKLLLQIAFVYRCLGRYEAALSALQSFLGGPGDATPVQIAAAQAEIARLKDRSRLLGEGTQGPTPATLPRTSPAARKRAQAALDQCTARIRARECPAALAVCGEAYAIFPSPKLLLNLASVHECLGHQAIAADLLETFLRNPGDSTQEQVDVAQEELSRLRADRPAPPHRVTLKFSWDPPFAGLFLDGKLAAAGKGAADLDVSEGRHHVQVRALLDSSYMDREFYLDARPGLAPFNISLKRSSALRIDLPPAYEIRVDHVRVGPGILSVEPGVHIVSAIWENGRPLSVTTHVIQGQTVAVDLQPRFYASN